MVIYCLFWMLNNMSLNDLVSDISYLMYCSVFIGCYVVATGTISVISSYYFVAMMYGNEKS